MDHHSRGGKARAEKLLPEDRKRIASEAARARWAKQDRDPAAAKEPKARLSVPITQADLARLQTLAGAQQRKAAVVAAELIAHMLEHPAAVGGVVTVDHHVAIVGEHGPEAILPKSRADQIAAAARAGMEQAMGDGSKHPVHVDVQLGPSTRAPGSMLIQKRVRRPRR